MQDEKLEIATFGAGCFWGVEEAFRKQKGVIETEAGYEGGNLQNPAYEDVCSDKTGHAEVVRVEFDPGQISYKQLLNIFWKIHDPTTPNRQGPDEGSQYRSVIFYHTPEEKLLAEESKEEVSYKYENPIVTEILPAKHFWRAEEYHQKYIAKGGIAHCAI